MPAVIEVRNLHKSYGTTVAVDDVSFTVEEGEIFGNLGPNGAGKTTTVECVEGLRAPGGFGLAAMRQRIEGLSGTLQVESEPGGGTAISARLPACPAGAAAPLVPAQAPA